MFLEAIIYSETICHLDKIADNTDLSIYASSPNCKLRLK